MIKNSNPAGNPEVRGFGRQDRPVAAGSPDRPEEFGQFEALTRKLVHVSKEELDEKRKDES
jgi:hypothetical protein